MLQLGVAGCNFLGRNFEDTRARVPLARYITTNRSRKLKETFDHANISADKDGLLKEQCYTPRIFIQSMKTFLHLVCFSLCPSLFRELRDNGVVKKITIFSLKPHSHIRILIYRTPGLLKTALRRSHRSDIWRQYRQKRGLARNPGHETAFTFGRARENGRNCHSLHEKEIGFKWPNYCRTT